MIIFSIIFRTVFFLFSVWSIIWVLGTLFKKNFIKGIDHWFVKLIILLGYIYVAILISCLTDYTTNYLVGRFGIYALTYFLLPQLLWFEKIQLLKIYRIVLALWILYVLYVDIFIYLMSINREYTRSTIYGWSFPL